MRKKKTILMSQEQRQERRQDLLSKISDTTRIPEDIVAGSCCITITGQNELIIENYKSILEYHSEKLVILTRQCRVEIYGKRLEILYYSRDEMKIKGKIECVTYKR